MSNEEVARKLLTLGLEGMEACVFLNSLDAKMIVDRSGGPPVPLAVSGIGFFSSKYFNYYFFFKLLAVENRFTFYDQIHTTGMDIKQALDATAAVTIGSY